MLLIFYHSYLGTRNRPQSAVIRNVATIICFHLFHKNHFFLRENRKREMVIYSFFERFLFFNFFLSDDKFDTLRFLCYNSCFNGDCYLSKHRINKRHFCQDTARVGRKTDVSLCSSVFLSRSPDSESFRSLITDNYVIDISADILDSYND